MSIVRCRNATLAMASADTTYSWAIPKGTRQLLFKLRSANVNLLYSWLSGAGGMSGGKYVTIPAGSSIKIEEGQFHGNTLYFQTGSVSQTVEIEHCK